MDISEIVNCFNFHGEILDIKPLGNGHINTTFLVTTEKEKYVIQKINNVAFKNVEGLMNNFYHVTNFLLSNGYESLEIVKTKERKLYLEKDGNYYRSYVFVDDVICYEGVEDLKVVEDAAQAFGKLHKSLQNFNAHALYETIPHFHDTYQRYLNLLDAIKTDKYQRVQNALPEIEEINKYKDEYNKVIDGINKGLIHLSVTHNDPKINNVLFDKKTKKLKMIIDLDTIMPGSYLYDFGDALRGLYSGENEDSKDLSKIIIKPDVFIAYSKGYLSEMKDVLNDYEKSLLPFSVFLLTIECGIRFLEDYIRGDIYFHTEYDEHNLVRTRTQLKIARTIFNFRDELLNSIRRYF